MCREKWYRYTCGHLISARSDQEGFEHCDDWIEGLDETECENHDAYERHATVEIDVPCRELRIPDSPGHVK